MTNILAAAEAIASARRGRTPLAPLAADIAPRSEADVYLIQDALHELLVADFVRVGVECEIAVKLARDLSPSEAPFTAEWVGEAIEAYLPAIEIVDDRYVEWQTIG